MSDEEEIVEDLHIGDVVGKRNIVNVMERVKGLIPKSYPLERLIRKKLTELQLMSKQRSSKDGHEILWTMGAQLLKDMIGELDTSWKKQIYAVWAKGK